jgi:hypothetical protein
MRTALLLVKSFLLLYHNNSYANTNRNDQSQLVYRKSLEIAPSKDSNSGQIVNMVSSDALFIADSVSIVAAGVSVPLQLISTP